MSSYQTIETPQDYVNYTFNISARGVTEVAGEMAGLSNTITTILGQMAFKTAEYLTHTESLMIGLGTVSTAAFASATQQAIKFEQAIANVQAIGGEAINAMKIGEAAMKYSSQFGMDVNSMTEGLEALSRAGLTATNVMSGVLAEGVKLSKLESIDLEESINNLISTTNLLATSDMDINSQEYADAVKAMNQHIVSTSESAPINAENIFQTLQHVGGYASANSIDQDDLFAVIAQLGAKGTKGEMAGTALRAFIAAGQKDQAQRALARIGLNVSDLWNEAGDAMLPISEMKDVIDTALEARGYSKQEKLEFYSDFAGYKQANQIMKIDTSEVQEYKENIAQAWDLGKKLETILGTTNNNLQILFQTTKNFMTKVGSTMLPIINAIIIPIKLGVQLLEKIPFSENITGLLLTMAGIKAVLLFINRVLPTLASMYTNFSKGEKEAGKIRKHFSHMVKDLQEAKNVLSNLGDPIKMSQIRLKNGFMGEQSYKVHKEVTRELYGDYYASGTNPDLPEWSELTPVEQNSVIETMEAYKSTDTYQQKLDEVVSKYSKITKNIGEFLLNEQTTPTSTTLGKKVTSSPKSKRDINQEISINQKSNEPAFSHATKQIPVTSGKDVFKPQTDNEVQNNIAQGILSVKGPLAEAIGRALSQSINVESMVVSDTLGTFQVDKIKGDKIASQLQEIENNVSNHLGDIGYFLDDDLEKIDRLLANVKFDLQRKITAYSNNDPNFMNAQQEARMKKIISGAARTNLGKLYSEEQNSIDILNVLRGEKWNEPEDKRLGIHNLQMKAMEDALGFKKNRDDLDRVDRLNNIHKELNRQYKGKAKDAKIAEILEITAKTWRDEISHDMPGAGASKYLTNDRAALIGNSIGIQGIDWNNIDNAAQQLIDYFKDTQDGTRKAQQLRDADNLMFAIMEQAKGENAVFNQMEADELGYIIRRYRQLLLARNKKLEEENKTFAMHDINDFLKDDKYKLSTPLEDKGSKRAKAIADEMNKKSNFGKFFMQDIILALLDEHDFKDLSWGDNYDRQLQQAQKQQETLNLTEEQIDAYNEYVGGRYENIKGFLSGKSPEEFWKGATQDEVYHTPLSTGLTAREAALILLPLMQQASGLLEDSILWHGGELNTYSNGIGFLPDIRSLSYLENIAESFIEIHPERYKTKVYTPAGTPGLIPTTDFGDFHGNEEEYTIPPSMYFELIRDDVNRYAEILIIPFEKISEILKEIDFSELELLPDYWSKSNMKRFVENSHIMTDTTIKNLGESTGDLIKINPNLITKYARAGAYKSIPQGILEVYMHEAAHNLLQHNLRASSPNVKGFGLPELDFSWKGYTGQEVIAEFEADSVLRQLQMSKGIKPSPILKKRWTQMKEVLEQNDAMQYVNEDFINTIATEMNSFSEQFLSNLTSNLLGNTDIDSNSLHNLYYAKQDYKTFAMYDDMFDMGELTREISQAIEEGFADIDINLGIDEEIFTNIRDNIQTLTDIFVKKEEESESEKDPDTSKFTPEQLHEIGRGIAMEMVRYQEGYGKEPKGLPSTSDDIPVKGTVVEEEFIPNIRPDLISAMIIERERQIIEQMRKQAQPPMIMPDGSLVSVDNIYTFDNLFEGIEKEIATMTWLEYISTRLGYAMYNVSLGAISLYSVFTAMYSMLGAIISQTPQGFMLLEMTARTFQMPPADMGIKEEYKQKYEQHLINRQEYNQAVDALLPLLGEALAAARQVVEDSVEDLPETIRQTIELNKTVFSQLLTQLITNSIKIMTIPGAPFGLPTPIHPQPENYIDVTAKEIRDAQEDIIQPTWTNDPREAQWRVYGRKGRSPLEITEENLRALGLDEFVKDWKRNYDIALKRSQTMPITPPEIYKMEHHKVSISDPKIAKDMVYSNPLAITKQNLEQLGLHDLIPDWEKGRSAMMRKTASTLEDLNNEAYNTEIDKTDEIKSLNELEKQNRQKTLEYQANKLEELNEVAYNITDSIIDNAERIVKFMNNINLVTKKIAERVDNNNIVDIGEEVIDVNAEIVDNVKTTVDNMTPSDMYTTQQNMNNIAEAGRAAYTEMKEEQEAAMQEALAIQALETANQIATDVSESVAEEVKNVNEFLRDRIIESNKAVVDAAKREYADLYRQDPSLVPDYILDITGWQSAAGKEAERKRLKEQRLKLKDEDVQNEIARQKAENEKQNQEDFLNMGAAVHKTAQEQRNKELREKRKAELEEDKAKARELEEKRAEQVRKRADMKRRTDELHIGNIQKALDAFHGREKVEADIKSLKIIEQQLRFEEEFLEAQKELLKISREIGLAEEQQQAQEDLLVIATNITKVREEMEKAQDAAKGMQMLDKTVEQEENKAREQRGLKTAADMFNASDKEYKKMIQKDATVRAMGMTAQMMDNLDDAYQKQREQKRRLDNAKKIREEINDVNQFWEDSSDALYGASGFLDGIGKTVDKFVKIFPPLAVISTPIHVASQKMQDLVEVFEIAQEAIGTFKVLNSDMTKEEAESVGLGKEYANAQLIKRILGDNTFVGPFLEGLGVNVTAMFDIGKTLMSIIAKELGVFIAANASLILPPLAVIAAAVGVLYLAEQEHAKALKKATEAQETAHKELTSSYLTYKNLHQARKNETDAMKRQQLARKESIALYNLEADRINNINAINEKTKLRNDGLWGEYGERARLQKMGWLESIFAEGIPFLGTIGKWLAGDFESQADNYDGTTKQIRLLKESSLAGGHSLLGGMATSYVARWYDANKMQLGQIEAFGPQLQELYDRESQLIEKYGSIEAARDSKEFKEAVQEFADATGLSKEIAEKYLDYLQTERNVELATNVMQAQISGITAKAYAKVAENEYGAMANMGDMDNLQNAMIFANFDEMWKDAYNEMFWNMLMEYLQAIISLLMKGPLGIADANKHLKNAAAYGEAQAELLTKGNEIYQSGVDIAKENQRNDYGTDQKLSYYGDSPTGAAKESSAAAEEDYALEVMHKNRQKYYNASKNNGRAAVSGFKDGLDQHSPGKIARSIKDEMKFTKQFIEQGNPVLLRSFNTISEGATSIFGNIGEGVDWVGNTIFNALASGSGVFNGAKKAFNKPQNIKVDNSKTEIHIHTININTEDDPEKIKTAFMNLMVELGEQVVPRQVSRTIGQTISTDNNVQSGIENINPNDSSTNPTTPNNNPNNNPNT